MKKDEAKRVAELSDWYLKEQLDFDKRMIRFRYETLKPHLKGQEGLELGPAEGHMTAFLLKDFKRLTVVEGAIDLLNLIPEAINLVKIHSLFEDFKPDHLFDTIIMEHILEHIEDPNALLRKVTKWLAPKGRLVAGVPNAHSIHRLVAVKMGLLKNPCELNQRDKTLGHRRVYTPETLKKEVQTAGLRIIKTGGVFFKPLSNQQIQDNWTEEMIQGFYELGKDFGKNAAELYAICEIS